ncbi:uncharacterized protein LOC114947456 [Acropora millepora]|uniref:uncharacterized protein LOC114947456 n=1 Tax=Acropora millepora TaxID=45264 RepID=UPI001CF58E92|nr:uncharacterized protein LOC114947456 [Acropora millepora]
MVDKSIVDEMSALYQKVASLEEENNEFRTKCLTLENIKEDNKKFLCFTELPNYATFKAFFEYLDFVALQKEKNWRGSKLESKSPSAGKRGINAKLTLKEEFFTVLTRPLCGLALPELALRNNLRESNVSRIFTTWINLLYFHLKDLCQMPDYCDDLGKPEQFSKFPDLKLIVDCTEIFTQRPSSLKANREIYSNYKSHTTFQFLVAINACAAIVYVSRGWGGRTSDKYITAKSVDFIAALEEGMRSWQTGGLILVMF